MHSTRSSPNGTYPPVGSQPSRTPKTSTSSRPAQNVGIAMPTWLKTSTTPPRTFLTFIAENVPRTSASGTDTSRAPIVITASAEAAAGSRRRCRSPFRRTYRDRRSPLPDPLRYCTTSGSSRPYASRMNALSPGAASLPRSTVTMSPPSMLTSTKITIEPTSAANNNENRERSVCFSIVVSTDRGQRGQRSSGGETAGRPSTGVVVGRRWLDRRIDLESAQRAAPRSIPLLMRTSWMPSRSARMSIGTSGAEITVTHARSAKVCTRSDIAARYSSGSKMLSTTASWSSYSGMQSGWALPSGSRPPSQPYCMMLAESRISLIS